MAALAEQLCVLHETIKAAPRQFLLIGEHDKQDEYISDLHQQWERVTVSGDRGFLPFTLPQTRTQTKQMWLTNSPVNFCSKAYATVPIEHEDAPALTVLAGFLRNGYLHRTVREQGGAYGGGASYQSDIAAFRFFSYRDPRLTETLNDFDQSIQWLLNEKQEWSQVEEAILGVIGSIDKPTSPAGEAKDAFVNALYGRTPQQRQQYRSRILKVNLDDLRRVAATYFDPDNASVAVISNHNNESTGSNLALEIFRV